jgi:peptide chain release factor
MSLERYVTEKKHTELINRMAKLNILESDLVEKFISGSGKGGQKKNKTDSCVYLKHVPSNFEIKCQNSRNRALNRFIARRILCEQIENQLLGKKSPAQMKIEKIRKQKKRRERRKPQ